MADREIWVRIEQVAVENIHNDLGNAAFFLRNQILKQRTSGEEDGGLHLQLMSALTMISFWFEACINFVGFQLFDKDFQERAPINSKVDMVFARTGLSVDRTARPLSTITDLIGFRNTLAHGKPKVYQRDEEVRQKFGEDRYLPPLAPDWHKMLSRDCLKQCYEDVDQVWFSMLAAIGKTEIETGSHGSSGRTYLRDVGPEEV